MQQLRNLQSMDEQFNPLTHLCTLSYKWPLLPLPGYLVKSWAEVAATFSHCSAWDLESQTFKEILRLPSYSRSTILGTQYRPSEVTLSPRGRYLCIKRIENLSTHRRYKQRKNHASRKRRDLQSLLQRSTWRLCHLRRWCRCCAELEKGPLNSTYTSSEWVEDLCDTSVSYFHFLVFFHLLDITFVMRHIDWHRLPLWYM